MNTFLNEKALELKQGAIRAMFDRAKNFPGSINLGIGEPDLNTPEEIIEAGCNALRQGKTHYTANAGLIELREKISQYLSAQKVDVDPETEIIVTTGGMGALALALMVTLSPGDEVLIQDPQWLNYYSQVRFCGGVPVPVPVSEENGFRLMAEDIEKKITPKSKVLMLNTPNNPTGAVLEYEDLVAISSLAKKHNLLVITDEVYSTLLYDGMEHKSILSLPDMKDRTILVNSFSKSFAMTGWRVGYAAGSRVIIDKMIKLQENLVACVATSSQYAAMKALDTLDRASEMTEIYRERRDLIVEGLNNIKGISCIKPKGSFYVFPNIKALGKTSEEVANELLEKAGVITVPGSAFGAQGEGYLRISYANSLDNIKEALNRIEKYTKELAL
ncbi:pyridoxal phosphate-dependent aminotransferase [Lutispora sp.]|uniref:pyridoxal phosphate-dependent aminotransferase n=1 Tax=Lutispora sp. TaxID=2828727 RepID=UPI00356AC1A8